MSDDTDRVETVDPEVEPEYVGAHSGLADAACENWLEPHAEGGCGAPATHTVVMYHDGHLDEIAMCDDCGEPDDVTDFDRTWTGEVFD